MHLKDEGRFTFAAITFAKPNLLQLMIRQTPNPLQYCLDFDPSTAPLNAKQSQTLP